MVRVLDQFTPLAHTVFAGDAPGLAGTTLAASNRMADTEFMRSGLGSAQLPATVASSKALPRKIPLALVFIMLRFFGGLGKLTANYFTGAI